MFETIDAEIEKTQGGPSSVSSMLVRFGSIAAVLTVFAAVLYYAIAAFE